MSAGDILVVPFQGRGYVSATPVQVADMYGTEVPMKLSTTDVTVDALRFEEDISNGISAIRVVSATSMAADRTATLQDASGTLAYLSDIPTVTGSNTGDQLVFKTISVSGQSDVVADTITDTLTLVAGSNVTITTNAGTDTITIAASSGGSVPAPELRSDATALTAADIAANILLGQKRYLLSSATGVPITLPPSTGSGVVLEFFVGLKPTSNGYVTDCDSTGTLDRFDSNLTRHDGADAAVLNIDGTTAGNHNRMTILNGAAGTGGERGDYWKLTDYLADHWLVEGSITAGAGAIAVYSAF